LHERAGATGRQGRRDEQAGAFLARLTAEELIELHEHGVSRAFVEQLCASGLRDLNVADLTGLFDHGVRPSLVRDLRDAGLTGLTPDQLVMVFDHGVDAAFVREMRGLGLANLTPDRWVDLRHQSFEGDPARGGRGQHTSEEAEWEAFSESDTPGSSAGACICTPPHLRIASPR